MSQTVSIDCEINEPLRVTQFIEQLDSDRWSTSFEGEITYLPLGDEGMYEWKSIASTNLKLFYDEISQKESINEVIGVVLIEKASMTGGELIFWPNYSSFSLSFSVNRCNMRDVDYYIETLKKSIALIGRELVDVEVGKI